MSVSCLILDLIPHNGTVFRCKVHTPPGVSSLVVALLQRLQPTTASHTPAPFVFKTADIPLAVGAIVDLGTSDLHSAQMSLVMHLLPAVKHPCLIQVDSELPLEDLVLASITRTYTQLCAEFPLYRPNLRSPAPSHRQDINF